jgi:hypothetical protein
LWCPDVWEAFMDYRFNAHTFSSQEMIVLKTLIENTGTLEEKYNHAVSALKKSNLSGREIEDFVTTIGLK